MIRQKDMGKWRAPVLKDGRDIVLVQGTLSWSALAGFILFANLRERLVITSDSAKVGWPKVGFRMAWERHPGKYTKEDISHSLESCLELSPTKVCHITRAFKHWGPATTYSSIAMYMNMKLNNYPRIPVGPLAGERARRVILCRTLATYHRVSWLQ